MVYLKSPLTGEPQYCALKITGTAPSFAELAASVGVKLAEPTATIPPPPPAANNPNEWQFAKHRGLKDTATRPTLTSSAATSEAGHHWRVLADENVPALVRIRGRKAALGAAEALRVASPVRLVFVAPAESAASADLTVSRDTSRAMAFAAKDVGGYVVAVVASKATSDNIAELVAHELRHVHHGEWQQDGIADAATEADCAAWAAAFVADEARR